MAAVGVAMAGYLVGPLGMPAVVLGLVIVGIVVVAELLDFPYVAWALLSYCMVLSVGADRRATRVIERIVGTLIGAVAATLVALAPAPVPIVAAVIATVLCVAYLRQGNYTMFVAFLTPSVLLTTGVDASAIALGAGRIEAVVAAGLLALALTAAVAAVGAALDRRRGR